MVGPLETASSGSILRNVTLNYLLACSLPTYYEDPQCENSVKNYSEIHGETLDERTVPF
jgi:hypothetical protein